MRCLPFVLGPLCALVAFSTVARAQDPANRPSLTALRVKEAPAIDGRLDDAAWQRHLEAKLFGTIRVLRAVAPRLVAQRSGRIVLIVGNSAKYPEPRMIPGAVANSGLLAIVRGLAEELGPHGVVINAVNPGPVRSARWDAQMQGIAAKEGGTAAEAEAKFLQKAALRRITTPEEVAAHVAFLASPRAAHMTGTSVTIDGGTVKTP